MQYEILGVSIEDLAEEYQIAPNVLKYAAEERGWKQSTIAASAQEYPSQVGNVPHDPAEPGHPDSVRRTESGMPGHPDPNLPPGSPEGGRSKADLRPSDGVRSFSRAELATSIAENQSLLRSVKQATLSPKYIVLESSLLGKCISLISQLPSDDPTVAPALKHICDIYKMLTETNIAQPKPAEERSAGNGMTLNIMNRVAVTEDRPDEKVVVQVGGEIV